MFSHFTQLRCRKRTFILHIGCSRLFILWIAYLKCTRKFHYTLEQQRKLSMKQRISNCDGNVHFSAFPCVLHVSPISSSWTFISLIIGMNKNDKAPLHATCSNPLLTSCITPNIVRKYRTAHSSTYFLLLCNI